MTAENLLAEAVIRSSDTCYSVPGYPVTELADKCRAEYAVNEKTALEYALGDSISGIRSVVIVKNAGMNALCDPLVSATTQGLRAGVVIVAGDDTNAKGSQNRQDSRYFAEVAEVPLLEPAPDDIASCVESAMQASEKFSRVCIIRVTQDILGVKPEKREIPYRMQKYGSLAPPNLTMKGRCEYADNITGEMYRWAKPPFVWPPQKESPGSLISATGDKDGRCFVSEHKNPCPPDFTEEPESAEKRGFARTLCKDCPYKMLFEIMAESGITAVCDTGCSLLSKNPPYGFGIANYGLGSSVAVAAKSTGVALIGDYALMHSGINALADICAKKIPLLCIVLKNSRMGMTGGQDIPDIMPHLHFAKPVMTNASSRSVLLEHICKKPGSLKVLVVGGQCPEDTRHETIRC